MSRPASLRTPGRFRVRYGPWAVVTGASGGIGREMAVTIAEAGLDLVLVARRGKVLDQVAAELTARYGIKTRVIAADLGSRHGVDAVQEGTDDLDVGLLIAAAGFGTSGSFLDADRDEELAMLDLNCGALLAMCLHFGGRFADRGRGGIVLMGSLVGLQGTPHAAHYAATKAYVQALAEGLHLELRPQGVDVLACAPGPVHSGFAARAGLRMGVALDAADVALPTLNALGRRTTVVPGLLSKVLTWSLVPLPRPVRARIMGSVMRGMTSGHNPRSGSKASRSATSRRTDGSGP